MPDTPPAVPEPADADAAVDAAVDAVDVYWRPHCGYCTRLLRSLERAGVVVRLHNIWEDDDARRFVRRHNRGNETVPTVALGAHVATNPAPEALIERLRAQHPALVTGGDAPAGLLSRLRR